jgi:hypothetical protein
MAFTVTPPAVHSFASARVRPAMPDFAAAYPGTLMPPWKLSSDAVKMILPYPRSSIPRAIAWVSTNWLDRLTSSTRSHASRGCTAAGARSIVPALLTRMSTRPPESRSASASTAARSAKSVAMPVNDLP